MASAKASLASIWHMQALDVAKRLAYGSAMETHKKNPAAVALGRLGGKVKSAAKTRAARANVLKRWAKSKKR